MLCGEGGTEELPECLVVLSGQLFKIVLGFTPRRRPWKAGPSQNDDFLPRFGIHPPSRQPSRAHQSQNDLGQLYSAPSAALPAGLSPLPFPVSPLPVFLTCNVGMKIGLPRTFSSGRVTSGNCQPAFQALLWHFLVFPIYHIRKKIVLSRTFGSRSVTSGNVQHTAQGQDVQQKL